MGNDRDTAAGLVSRSGAARERALTSGKLGRGRAWFGIIVGGLSLGLFTFAVLAAT
jgi:hypothetical protein